MFVLLGVLLDSVLGPVSEGSKDSRYEAFGA